MPRNFATLAQLGLLRLFTGLCEKRLAPLHSYFPALSRRQTLYIDIMSSQCPVITIGRSSQTFPRLQPCMQLSLHTATASNSFSPSFFSFFVSPGLYCSGLPVFVSTLVWILQKRLHTSVDVNAKTTQSKNRALSLSQREGGRDHFVWSLFCSALFLSPH